MSDTRQQIESTADRIRDELLVTLRELDRRRHMATDLRFQVEKHIGLILLLGGGTLAIAGGLTTVAMVRRRYRRRHGVQRRLDGLIRAWKHPERIASHADEAPVAVELGRRLALAFAIALGTRLVRQLARQLVPEKPKDPNTYYN